MLRSALGGAEVSAGHLDAMAAATKGLDEPQLAAFLTYEDDLLAAARTMSVDAFTRECRGVARHVVAASTDGAGDAAELDRQRAQANVKRWVDKTTGMRLTLLELDPVSDATVWSTIDAQLASLRKADGNARTPWQRMQVDAVVAAVGAGPGADRVPEIMVLSDHATLVRGLHANSVCETVDGVPLPVSTVRRMCCDADIVPALRPPRLHRRVLGVPDPPREVVVARSRRHRHRQSAPTVRTPPPPRPRRGLGPHDDPGSSRHLDPSGRHRSLDRHHHRPRTARDRHTPSRLPRTRRGDPDSNAHLMR